MPRFNLTGQRPTRQDRSMQQSQIDLQQQQTDSSQQSDNIGNIMKLYGLQQERQQAPEKLRGMTLQNDAQANDNAWQNPLNEARYNATTALSDQRERPKIDPQLAMYLHGNHLIDDNELADMVLPADARAARHMKAAQLEAERQAAMKADAAQQGHGAAPSGSPISHSVMQIMLPYQLPMQIMEHGPELGQQFGGMAGGAGGAMAGLPEFLVHLLTSLHPLQTPMIP